LFHRVYQAKAETKNALVAMDVKQFEEWAFNRENTELLTPEEIFRLWGKKHGWDYCYSFLLFIEEIYWRDGIQK